MKKKHGFTLAEVLITIGIIGVVAALTAPALTKNSSQAQIGPKLAKFVNSFETACENLFYNENISKLTAIGNALPDQLLPALSEYLIMTPLSEDSENYTYSTGAGELSTTVEDENHTRVYILKDGSLLVVENAGGADHLNGRGAYRGTEAVVIYDINGIKEPNRASRDVFKFLVDDSGILIPFGSQAHKFLNPDFDAECNTLTNDWDDSFACTGKIADANWKVEDDY